MSAWVSVNEPLYSTYQDSRSFYLHNGDHGGFFFMGCLILLMRVQKNLITLETNLNVKKIYSVSVFL